MAEPVHLLDQSAGYGILVGVGAAFAIGMILTTKWLQKYLNENANSTETFSVANRTVGTALTTSAVYSSWSWSTELLWVCTMVYNYGLQAAYYYSAGLAIQIATMATIGIHAKKKIPQAHTSLEIIQLRYGKACHILYLFLCLVNNLLSCSSMILAAAGAISIISGNLHIVASTMLIPFGVLLYTAVGGLKATFLTDFVHTLILLIILCYINTSVLASEQIGGLHNLYDLLVKHDGDKYIEGNYLGSVLTGKSQGAVIFGLILTAGNFGLCIMDSSFWQKTFSSDVRSTVPGYLTAAVLIFSNAWPIGTIVGGAALVLSKDPSFPTYPRAMTQFEIDSGYVLPFIVKTVLGNGGLGAILLVIYLAVTSTVSAQLISVSSIVSFDIYKKYINPRAQNKHMMKVSHVSVIFFGLFAAGFSVMLHYVGTNMTWLGYFYPMIICPGVIPIIFSITWDRQSRLAAFISPIIGMFCGLAIWLGTAYKYYGTINIETTIEQLPSLWGSLTALFLPAIVSITVSLIQNEKFDWKKLQKADILIEKEDDSDSSSDQLSKIDITETTKEISHIDSNRDKGVSNNESEIDFDTSIELGKHNGKKPISEKELNFYIKIATGATIFILLITWVLWPMPLYRDWIWNRAYFEGSATASLIWLYSTLIIVGLYPIYDGRHTIAIVVKGVYRDLVNFKWKTSNT